MKFNEAKLWDRVAVADGCWEWLGAKSKGYGQIRVNGKQSLAHRVMYEYAIGPIPTGLVIDHGCNNPGCVNPAHLFPKTIKQNVLRGSGLAAKRARQTHCKRGHEFTSDNTYVYPSGARECRACRSLRLRGEL